MSTAPADGSAGDDRRISRRRFLRRTLAGAAALALGGTALRHLGGYSLDARTAAALRVLSPKEAVILGAIARRLLAPDGDDAPAVDDLDVVPAIDRYLGEMPPELVADIRALLHLVEHAPSFLSLHLSRFTRLGATAQDEVLSSWASSRLDFRRQGFAALKSLAAIGYYGDARTFSLIGYAPMGVP
jgi:hypothetical protein